MIRIHLAQIFYKSSYYDSSVDYLEEPSFIMEMDTPVGRLRSIEQIQSFLLDSKGSYIEYLRTKLSDIARWSGNRGSHLLVFPEYSVPLQILPDLQEIAQKFSMIIVAGTHRVMTGNEAESIYKKLSIIFDSSSFGCAISPIILPDGSIHIAKKLRKSKWEPNLNVPLHENPKIITTDCRGISIRLSVVPCIDSLHLDVLGKLWESKENTPHIVICPSLSPSTDPFKNVGSCTTLQGTLFSYINTASFGGTSYCLPKHWEPYFEGFHHTDSDIPKDAEAILELNVDLQEFFIKKGSIKNAPICSHPCYFSVIYTSSADWLSKFYELREDIIEWLTNNERDTAIEWLDSYLTDEASNLPYPILHNLKYIRHSILPLYDGNIDSIKILTELVKISDKIDDIKIHWAKRVNEAIQLLTEYLKVSANDTTQLLFKCLQDLKKLQQNLPQLPLTTSSAFRESLITPRKEKLVFTGDENLVEAFQNRGPDLDKIRNFFANNDNRVIVIAGAIGIGKSAFINWMFRKAFGDWKVIRIKIPSEAKVSRIVSEIGYQLGIPLDVDSLASTSHKIFRQKVRKILAQFYSVPKRALLVDDLHEILKVRNARDYRHLAIFLDEAASPEKYHGGRIFFISSQWLPENWLNAKGISRLRLKGISDVFIQRIIEYHMRQADLINGEAPLEAPQALLDIIKRHPLSARLVVEALHDSNLHKLSDELTLVKVTGYIAKELLKRVELTYIEESVIKKLTVFRLPMRVDVLKDIKQFDLGETEFKCLAERCILSYDGYTFEMHEAVRRFYYTQISKSDLTKYHSFAALYYKKIYEEQISYGRKDPNIIAELIHHLSLSGELAEIKNLRLLVVEELKLSARKIYREYRNWPNALSLYRLLAEIVPDDPEVLAYLGRCYARLGQWDESDNSFQKALDMASKTGRPIWWIYRDWGHIKARYDFYTAAKELFDRASDIHPYDPSIKATLAYMHWKSGDDDIAYDLFEEALNLESYHEYTLTFYPKFLDSIGQYDYADILREKLQEMETGTKYVEPTDYDIDFDYDDMSDI